MFYTVNRGFSQTIKPHLNKCFDCYYAYMKIQFSLVIRFASMVFFAYIYGIAWFEKVKIKYRFRSFENVEYSVPWKFVPHPYLIVYLFLEYTVILWNRDHV